MTGFDGEAGLRALADPRRRQMLALTWDRERSPSDLARRCQLSRPAASQHLKLLRAADLVSVRSEGNRRWYRARADRLAELRAILDRFWSAKLAALQAELTPAESAELTPAESAELTPAESAELTPAESAELTPAESAELTPAEQGPAQ
ncbi:MAG: ArsR/SmtB family transcription factor [Streptosporangiaceae bacterium]